jgi:phage terminase small subunit
MSEIKLTPKQEKFCQEYVTTNSKTAAYRAAYNTANMKDETVNNKAYQLSNRDDIRARISQLKEKDAKKYEITKDFIVKELLWVIENAKYSEKIDFNAINKASDTLNKMFGHNAPEKVEHSGELNINTLASRLNGSKSN